jgi:hypothetical protein
LATTGEVTDTYIPEARGRQVIEVLVDATAGRTSYKEWYAKEGHVLGWQDRERVERFMTSRIIDCSERALQKKAAEQGAAADKPRSAEGEAETCGVSRGSRLSAHVRPQDTTRKSNGHSQGSSLRSAVPAQALR